MPSPGHGADYPEDWDERAISSLAFSLDGRTLASASADRTVRLWDAASGQLHRTLSGHEKPVRAVAFSPDGRLIASASWDRTVKLWDAAEGRLVRTIQAHDKASSPICSPRLPIPYASAPTATS